MKTGIQRIGRISSNADRVEPVRRYTPEERAEKIKEINEAANDRAELRALLAKYPNPNNLSFAELLENGGDGGQIQDDESGYILDISK